MRHRAAALSRRWTVLASAFLVPALLGAGGCAALNATTGSSPAQSWPSVLAVAQSRAAESRFDAADSVLAEYASRFPGTPQTLETAYWRALYRMDPSNAHASLTGAMAALDGYLADSRPRQHVPEASTIRRVAGQLDALNKLTATAMAQAKDASATAKDAKALAADASAKVADAAPPSSEAEVKRLKEELGKANAELERIRKRLSQPPPKSP